MHNPKPAKLQARNFKNILISSRNQSEALQNSIRNSQLKKTPTFEQRIKDTHLKVSIEEKQLASSRRSQDSGTASLSKRLKLKDYIHLNGLEKKSRSKSSISSHQLISKTQQPIKNTNNLQGVTQFSLQQISAEDTNKVPHFSLKKIPDSNYSLMIRQEIVAKIEQERKKLGDLETYLMRDFQPKDNQTETFVFLFNILNKMGEVHAINQAVGVNVKDYEKSDSVQELRRTNVLKKESYHWEEAPKELDSPAKIMSGAMKLTFDLASLLGIQK